MDAFRPLIEFWPVILSGVGFIVWLVRLEGKTGENYRYIILVDKKVDVLETKHESLDSKTVEQLSQVRESLARIEGALHINRERT